MSFIMFSITRSFMCIKSIFKTFTWSNITFCNIWIFTVNTINYTIFIIVFHFKFYSINNQFKKKIYKYVKKNSLLENTPYGIWTHDQSLRRRTLFHWANRAIKYTNKFTSFSIFKWVRNYNLILFCFSFCLYNYSFLWFYLGVKWKPQNDSPRHESNMRPPELQSDALPIVLQGDLSFLRFHIIIYFYF